MTRVLRAVHPASVRFQPGDRSVRSAPERAASVAEAFARGQPLPPPLLVDAGDGWEVRDGNARVWFYQQNGLFFDAIVVSRVPNPDRQPTDPLLYERLVAEARSLVDEKRVSFRWPSSEAQAWIEHQYSTSGGRWRASNASRREGRDIEAYHRLWDELQRASDLASVGAIARRLETLRSPVLQAVIADRAVRRAQELGLECPPENCLDLVREHGLQLPLPNPVWVRPNAGAQRFASQGLEARRQAVPSKRCCTPSGLARARAIIRGDRQNAVTVRNWFRRHEGYYEAAVKRAKREGISLRRAAPDEPAIQAWWIWGGDPMRKLSESAVRGHSS